MLESTYITSRFDHTVIIVASAFQINAVAIKVQLLIVNQNIEKIKLEESTNSTKILSKSEKIHAFFLCSEQLFNWVSSPLLSLSFWWQKVMLWTFYIYSTFHKILSFYQVIYLLFWSNVFHKIKIIVITYLFIFWYLLLFTPENVSSNWRRIQAILLTTRVVPLQ